MILEDFALLLGNTARSKAYLQLLLKNNLIPAECIVFASMAEMEKEADDIQGKDHVDDEVYFDRNESLLQTMEKFDVPFKQVENKDINSEELINVIAGLKQQYIIYSGYGGAILKAPLFGLGKKFIHVHAGMLPYYRGSTTAYYSILNTGNMGATAIFLNERIDEGEILCMESFEPPSDVDIDYVFEPYTRAVVLVKCINEYLERGKSFKPMPQPMDGAETYFIIHPVLKHLALKRIGKEE